MRQAANESGGFLLPPEDEAWRPGRLTTWWAGLPDGARNQLRKTFNPHNQTRIHLARLIDRNPGQIMASPYTYGRPKVRFAEMGSRLRIGRYGSIADGVEIFMGGNHRLEWITTYPFPAIPGLWPEARTLDGSHASRGGVSIGHDVWLGSQCLVLSGVTIGHGAVVAARAVVTRDVPPYAIVAGNPAKVVRYRMPPERIEALLALRWWEWPEAEIKRRIPLLMSDRVEELAAPPGT